MQPLPDAGFLPVAQAPPAGGAAATPQLSWQQPPRASGPQDEDDAAEGGTIRDPRAATLWLWRLLWQQRFEGFPEDVGDQG